MGFKLVDSFDIDIEQLKVGDIYNSINGDNAADIPFWVWFLENPKSPVPMPGKISLFNHDHLHILLGRGQSPEDEAFIVGFTMGNDPNTKWYHILIFKIFSYWIYPDLYKLDRQQMKVFDLGFNYGRKIDFKEIHKVDFATYKFSTLISLRNIFGIESREIMALRKLEKLLIQRS